MASQTPAVTVVLPTHNRPGLLLEAIQSVQSQDFDDWELIIVDDASTSPAQIPEDPQGRIRLIRHKLSRGGAEAKNTGSQEAQGTFLAFLDDDDLYRPSYLSTAIAAFTAHPTVDTLFMGVDWFGSASEWGRNVYQQAMDNILKGVLPKDNQIYLFDEELTRLLLNAVPMAFQRPVVKREMFYKIGTYRNDCLLWDCDWAIRASLASNCALAYQPLYRQRVDHQGFSSKPSRANEHMESNIDIKQRILQELEHSSDNKHLITVFRQALSEAWVHLAYNQYNDARFAKAFISWIKSQRAHPSLRRISFPLKLFIGAFKEILTKMKGGLANNR